MLRSSVEMSVSAVIVPLSELSFRVVILPLRVRMTVSWVRLTSELVVIRPEPAKTQVEGSSGATSLAHGNRWPSA
jgi:hypothetical protein